MRILDGYTKRRFRQLADGRTIFLPKGEDGPAYLVPDEPTRQRPERRAAEDSGWQSAALAGAAVVVVVVGLAIFVVHPTVWVQSVGLLIAAVSAWFLQLALHDVRRSREIRRQHVDQPRYERTYEWAGNRRTRRRFS